MDLCEPLQEMGVWFEKNRKENVSDCEGFRVTSAFQESRWVCMVRKAVKLNGEKIISNVLIVK